MGSRHRSRLVHRSCYVYAPGPTTLAGTDVGVPAIGHVLSRCRRVHPADAARCGVQSLPPRTSRRLLPIPSPCHSLQSPFPVPTRRHPMRVILVGSILSSRQCVLFPSLFSTSVPLFMPRSLIRCSQLLWLIDVM